MAEQLSDSRLANLGARAIVRSFDDYVGRFRIITRRARIRFRERDWHAMAADAAERLDLYSRVLADLVADLGGLLGGRQDDQALWAAMKAVYSGLIDGRDEWELAETFFNSVTRKMFTTVGVDPHVEFVDTDFDTPPTSARTPVYRVLDRAETSSALFEEILGAAQLPLVDPTEQAKAVAARVEGHLRDIGALQVVERAEAIRPVFYRGQSAHLIGRLFSGSHVVPFALVVVNEPEGGRVDAVLLTENALSILFSFTRSYFHVDVERPYDLVQFLRSLMPRKRVAEIYNAIGHNKHGKTELYRDLIHHVAASGERFAHARGERGMVMSVFTMPGFDVVFKVIRDAFPLPKTTSRREVRDKYRLVFRHDRAGRLVEAQEFEHLRFDRDRFEPDLLDELTSECGETVAVAGRHVVLGHAYVERRVIPLDVYVREADTRAARAAIRDYGRCMKDLAASDIFPGDMLLKNFGVTRHGRVVFYDYDELAPLTECVFRELPEPETAEQELAAEPWFTVGPHDIFPAEFRRFLGLPPGLREVFEDKHAALFEASFWTALQRRLAGGELIPVYPYEEEQRL